MTYSVYYKHNKNEIPMFSVTIYMGNSEDNLYHIELITNTFLINIMDFVKNYASSSDEETWDQFKEYCSNIQKLNFWLWEFHDNSPRSIEVASEDKENCEREILEFLSNFANKYNLFISKEH